MIILKVVIPEIKWESSLSRTIQSWCQVKLKGDMNVQGVIAAVAPSQPHLGAPNNALFVDLS